MKWGLRCGASIFASFYFRDECREKKLLTFFWVISRNIKLYVNVDKLDEINTILN
jgi:hypothetical protein